MLLSRRQFLERSALGVTAAAALAADPLGLPVATQTWPVRQFIGKDFPGTLRKLSSTGYQRIEMCSPTGYVEYGFGSLAAMKGSEVRRMIEDADLKCESCHFGFHELKSDLDARIAWAKEMGLSQMVLASFELPQNPSMEDWRRAADEYNKIGEKIKAAGIQPVYHNHDFEFKKFDGKLVYDELMSIYDPNTIKMQFQVAVISLGYRAEDFMNKYPGRIISLHCADWSPSEKKVVPLGKGVVDWPKVFTAARTGGVKNYFVEVEDLEQTVASYPYIHNLKV